MAHIQWPWPHLNILKACLQPREREESAGRVLTTVSQWSRCSTFQQNTFMSMDTNTPAPPNLLESLPMQTSKSTKQTLHVITPLLWIDCLMCIWRGHELWLVKIKLNRSLRLVRWCSSNDTWNQTRLSNFVWVTALISIKIEWPQQHASCLL